MTAQKESKLVFPLTGGVVEDVVDETTEGAIIVSTNTRLSVNKGTLARRPLSTLVGEIPGGECGAIVNGVGDSMCAYFRPRLGQRRIVDSTGSMESVKGFLKVNNETPAQNAYYPNQIVSSGQAFSCQSLLAPAVCFDSAGNRWMIVLGSARMEEIAIYVKVYSPDGDLLVSEREIARPSKMSPDVGEGETELGFPEYLVLWFGITQNNSNVVVWYQSGADIYAMRLALDGTGGVEVLTPATAVYSMFLSGGSLSKLDVCSDGGEWAYMVIPVSAAAVSVQKFNQNTLTANVSASLENVWDIVTNVAIQHYAVGGEERILVAVSSAGEANIRTARYDSSLALSWATDTVAEDCHAVAVQPWKVDGNDYVVVAVTIGLAFRCAVLFYFFEAATGNFLAGAGAPWSVLQSRGFFHQISDSEIYPYFTIFPNYNGDTSGSLGPDPSSEGYVIDPSIEIVTPCEIRPEIEVGFVSVVGRFGVDRSFGGIMISSNANRQASGKAILSYLENRLSVASNFAISTTRWVELDLEPQHQPSVALDEGGVSSVAAAYPIVWDGEETADITLAHRPIVAVGTSGTGPALTGTYAFSAVYSWRDAAGNLRRSAPALPVTIELTDQSPNVDISVPLAFRNSITQGTVECTVYCTLNNGFIFYANNVATQTASFLFFELLDVRHPSASSDRLYSTGAVNEPLLPACPPPLWDLTTIGNRQWGIDAEFRNRLLPSKLKEPGIAFEFAPELAISIDEQFGKLMKVVDVGGNVFILAERGTWAISGYGPDNSGQGAGFSDPQLVNTVGCFSRHSVVQVPGIGVLYQAQDGKFALLGRGGAKRFETINVYAVEAPTIHMAECEVVYPITGTNECIVYNWLADGWTHWVNDNIGEGVTAITTIQDTTSKTYFFVPQTGQIRKLNSSSVDSTNGELVVERGWVAPEGPQGDCCMREIWVQLRYPTGWSHGISVTVEYDYGQSSSSVTRSWTPTELSELSQGERVTVGLNCQGKSCRSFKVRVQDTAGSEDYMMPINLTVTYAANAGNQRRALRAGALK